MPNLASDSTVGDFVRRRRRSRPALTLTAKHMRPFSIVALALVVCYPQPGLAQVCSQWRAVFELVEGSVEIRAADMSEWQAADQDSQVCRGYSVRVHTFGRAMLRLPDNTLVRMDRNTNLTFPEPENGSGSLLDLILGVIHVISRDPRTLRFNTPYANAGLEGTEFVLAVTESTTEVTVVEGEVSVSNEAGQIGVLGGQRAITRGAQAPRANVVSDPFIAIDWTQYYPRILDADLPPPDGNPAPAEQNNAEYYGARAASRLAAGGPTAAEADLNLALSLDPRDSTAHALKALLALRHGDQLEASSYAENAVANDTQAAAPLLARSYVQQAQFDLASALAAVENAVGLEPSNAIAWARLAELRLALDNTAAAEEAANRAAQLNPNLAHVQTVLGFSRLSQSRSGEAITAFRRATQLDQASPLPRIGLGLALIRQGELESGREQIEIAVSLDPKDALARSYMGKTYSAEHRTNLTDTQLALARVLDPADPTPLLYEALNKQANNRPVEALKALHSAFDLNGDSAVFRSRLRLDQDLAARSAGIGQLHLDLNFEQLALLDGWKATISNPDDYSAHRLLADSYSMLPRHQIARVNEFYQAQLLQPTNVTPVQAQLAEANPFILDRAGPTQLAFSEFNAPVDENGVSIQGSAITAGNGTDGADVAIAGRYDQTSFNIGHFDFATDGFRENNDFDQQVTTAFLQLHPNHETSYQFELRSSEIDKGDLRLLFDRNDFIPSLRQIESVDSARFGIRRTLSKRNVLLGSVILEDASTAFTTGPSFANSLELDSSSVDIQHQYRGDRIKLISGMRALNRDQEEFSHITAMLPFPPFQFELTDTSSFDVRHFKAYSYANIEVNSKLTATLGFAAESLHGRDISQDLYSPKLGLIWNPNDRTTIRATAFRTLQGPFISKQNIQPQLEPTHVAGFNQYFFGSEGEEASRFGLGLDHQFSTQLYAGIELTKRDLDTPVIVLAPDLSEFTQFVNIDESLYRAYLYWMPNSKIGISAAHQYENIDNHGEVLGDGHAKLRTHRTPISVNWFPSHRFRARFAASYVDQRGDFSAMTFGPSPLIETGEDSFWTLDLSLTYRLPRRHGALSLLLDNALDEEFQFQDTDPENPRIIPERMLSLRFTLSY